MFVDDAIAGDRNVVVKETEKILKYKDLTIEIQGMWNVKPKAINGKTGNWNPLKIIQKIPEPHNGKARNAGNIENSHIWHCTHISQSTNVISKALTWEIALLVPRIVTAEYQQHYIP